MRSVATAAGPTRARSARLSGARARAATCERRRARCRTGPTGAARSRREVAGRSGPRGRDRWRGPARCRRTAPPEPAADDAGRSRRGAGPRGVRSPGILEGTGVARRPAHRLWRSAPAAGRPVGHARTRAPVDARSSPVSEGKPRSMRPRAMRPRARREPAGRRPRVPVRRGQPRTLSARPAADPVLLGQGKPVRRTGRALAAAPPAVAGLQDAQALRRAGVVPRLPPSARETRPATARRGGRPQHRAPVLPSEGQALRRRPGDPGAHPVRTASSAGAGDVRAHHLGAIHK